LGSDEGPDERGVNVAPFVEGQPSTKEKYKKAKEK
jgi:hypothetical protein